MGAIADPNFQGLALKLSKRLGVLPDNKLDFRTGLPFPANLFDSGARPDLLKRIALSRTAMCELWYDCRRLRIDAPGFPTGYATLKYLFKSSGTPDPSEHITYTPGANALPAGPKAFFYPLVWSWTMDLVLDSDDLILPISFESELDPQSGVFPDTDGKKIFPRLTFGAFHQVDHLPQFVTSTSGGDGYSQVGTINILGQQSNLWTNAASPGDFGDVTVSKDESWG